MRLSSSFSCAAGALLLAACSSTPEYAGDPYAELNDPGLYSDTGNSGYAIPPSARARRAANPYPNSQGVSEEVRAAVSRQERAFVSEPAPADGYYASPQSRAQVESELQAEYESRDEAFGNFTRGEPRPIDLGPGPGLTRISPDSSYATDAQVFRSPENFRSVQREPLRAERLSGYDEIPSDAPPLPSSARAGQCYVLVQESPRYRNVTREVDAPARYRTVTERVLVEPETTTWRSNCAPDRGVANSTGETACLVRQPARYETVTRRVPVNTGTRRITERERVDDGGYRWQEIPCEDQSRESGNRVTDLQRALRREGYDPGPIDGIFGQQTRRAANAYQRDRGLPVVSHMDDATLRDLGIYSR